MLHVNYFQLPKVSIKLGSHRADTKMALHKVVFWFDKLPLMCAHAGNKSPHPDFRVPEKVVVKRADLGDEEVDLDCDPFLRSTLQCISYVSEHGARSLGSKIGKSSLLLELVFGVVGENGKKHLFKAEIEAQYGKFGTEHHLMKFSLTIRRAFL